MQFLVIDTLKFMLRNIRVNIIVIVTLLFAYLAFFLGCSYIEDGIRDFDTFQLKEMDSSIYYDGRVPYIGSKIEYKLPESVLADFFRQYDFVEAYTVCEFSVYQNQMTSEKLRYYAIQESFSDFYFFDVLEGRYFTDEEFENGSAVCLVEKTYQDLYSVKVGDTVNIDGTVFEIVGVIKRNADAGGIFLPYRTLQDDVSKAQYLQRYTIAAELTDHIFMSQIDYGQLGLSGVAKTARDYYRENIQFFFSRSVMVIAVCLILFTYALLNLFNILYSKMDGERKTFGIRIALGASHRQVFLQFFLECLILVLSSVILIFIMDPLISILIKGVMNHYFGVYTFISMLLVSVVSSYFVSLALMSRFKKMNVVEIMKDL